MEHARYGTHRSFAAVMLLVLGGGLAGCRPREAGTPAEPGPVYIRAPLRFAVLAEGSGREVVDELEKYARLYACPPVDEADGPEYVLSGEIRLTEGEPATFEGTIIQYQWQVDANLELTDTATGTVVESFTLDGYRSGKAEKELSRRAAVRGAAGKLAEFVFYDGKVLGQPDVRDLLAELVIENSDGLLYNDVISRVKAAGMRAAPYLIWKLNDRRLVALSGDLPGVTDETASKVRVYHVANRVLELLFERETALTVDSPRAFVERLFAGWHAEWRKQCGGYLRGDELKQALRRRAAERKAVEPPPTVEK